MLRDFMKCPNETSVDFFELTQWSIVLKAQESDAERARYSLELLCSTYWSPLYAFVRRKGYSQEDSEDLTQGFFTYFLSKKAIFSVHPHYGKFRAFLLASIKNYILNEWDRSTAQKRGGKKIAFSIDTKEIERDFISLQSQELGPEEMYDQKWAFTLLNKVLNRMREEYRKQNQEKFFEVLKPCMMGEKAEGGYAQIAQVLGMSVGAVKISVFRMRTRFQMLIRNEIQSTVSSVDQVEEELQALLSALQ